MQTQFDYLKVVAKRPVSEHLKEGVVVDVLADVVKVIVFAAGAYTLLTVDGARQSTHPTVGIDAALEDRLELNRRSRGQKEETDCQGWRCTENWDDRRRAD